MKRSVMLWRINSKRVFWLEYAFDDQNPRVARKIGETDLEGEN
jgi:hypothetical protein